MTLMGWPFPLKDQFRVVFCFDGVSSYHSVSVGQHPIWRVDPFYPQLGMLPGVYHQDYTITASGQTRFTVPSTEVIPRICHLCWLDIAAPLKTSLALHSGAGHLRVDSWIAGDGKL